MNKSGIDLDKHFCITSEAKITKIIAPLAKAFGIKHFRYLKLYNDESRIILSNFSDCIKFVYGEDHYKKMWFDGEFRENLNPGWYVWDMLRAIYTDGEVSQFEQEINANLSLSHGLTYVCKGNGFNEIYTFDTDNSSIYHIDKNLLLRFMYYFKENAVKLINYAEHEKLIMPASKNIIKIKQTGTHTNTLEFLKQTNIKRYYLHGKYSGIYLTHKEVMCLYWLLQGKSAEEIAAIDGNKARTIESHFENIKKKLNCFKQTQLIKVIVESGIMDTIADY